jgi:hypothetical protein
MVHDDRTYLDDEGLEYSGWEGRKKDPDDEEPARLSPGGYLWGADETYGGYDVE